MQTLTVASGSCVNVLGIPLYSVSCTTNSGVETWTAHSTGNDYTCSTNTMTAALPTFTSAVGTCRSVPAQPALNAGNGSFVLVRGGLRRGFTAGHLVRVAFATSGIEPHLF